MNRSSLLLAGLIGVCTVASAAEVIDDITFTATNDFYQQRYVRVLPDGFQAANTYDMLITLHGHGADRWQFVTDIRDEVLAARDAARMFNMIQISPDYRGNSWMGTRAEEDLVQIIGALKEQYNIGRVVISGGSMGGTAALTFTVLHPGLIDGVVSFNGLADLENLENIGTDLTSAIEASFGGTTNDVPQEYHNRSAINFPERFTMPLAITAGGADTVLPPHSVTNLGALVAQAGNRRVNVDFAATRGHDTPHPAALLAYQFVMKGNIGGFLQGGRWMTCASPVRHSRQRSSCGNAATMAIRW